MIAAKKWNGKGLVGTWSVTLKLDGVRALSDGKRVRSRKNKPLYNLDHLKTLFNDAEVWLGDFKSTISTVRSSTKVMKIEKRDVYNIDPLDNRLHLGLVTDPSAAEIMALLKKHTRHGCDGLMLRNGDRWLKVKHKHTLDVKVLGYKPGKAGTAYAGLVGALITTHGDVCSGLKLAQRRKSACKRLFPIGSVVEVEALEMTEKNNRFKHARLIRARPDKS